jgi:hypothetical protein
MIERMSPALREQLTNTIRQLPPHVSEEDQVYEAMKIIVGRIDAGETGLHDPENSGDKFAIALARLG